MHIIKGSKVPVREGLQNANIGGCLGWRSLVEQLVSSQKNIRYTNQLLRRIDNGRSSVTGVVLIHLLTEQVGQNEWQNQQ